MWSDLSSALKRSPRLAVADEEILEQAAKYASDALPNSLSQDDPWASLSMLWPPRLVGAKVNRKLAGFFGAGMSLAAGTPSWRELLTRHFMLADDLLQDKDLGEDPLTLAQLAAEQVGYERVRQILRETMADRTTPTTAHVLLAALRLPVYITTNYDALFERAWNLVFPHPLDAVIVNDLDLSTGTDPLSIVDSGGTVLLKMHGCVTRAKEQLILTRRDYRTHYRSNEKFFALVRKLLRDYHVLFLGFSHKDPEVSRLVEDVIYDYERASHNDVEASPAPHFYSLQFDMRSHSPEVFAARGIVALKPPITQIKTGDLRSLGLVTALCDLDGGATFEVHKKASIDSLLRDCLKQIDKDIYSALTSLGSFVDKAILTAQGNGDASWLTDAVATLGAMAGQGIWSVNQEGVLVDYNVPPGLSRTAREEVLRERAKASKRPLPPNGLGWLDDRPYFRVAKTFQDPFVSDVYASIFNQHGTVFLCYPLIQAGQFRGLLFAATQAGAWKTPVTLAEKCLKEERQLILVDSNGVLIVPTVGDDQNRIVPAKSAGPGDLEDRDANVGFPFTRLLELSRRDMLVAHIANNIVPVSQDDDIVVLSPDLTQYSVIAEVPHSRLKLAVTRGIR